MPKEQYTFSDALTLLKQGKMVRRHWWRENGDRLYILKAYRYRVTSPFASDVTIADAIMIDTLGPRQHYWTATQQDLLAEDWEIA